MPNQPTILVKKSDGTTVRMTLDEVKKMKGGQKSVTFESSKPVVDEPETVTEKAIEMLQTPELESAPVELLLNDEPHLLHEKMEPHEVGKPELVVVTSYDSTIAEIVRQAQLTPKPELLPRLQSLIMSFLKGIRTSAQVLEYAAAPVARGGLALTSPEVDRLATAIAKQGGRPTVIPKPMTAPAEQAVPSTKINFAPQRVPSMGAAHVPMHDVSAPAPTQKAVMGPIEEMKNFSLLDWRRLAATPDKAKEIILSKFTGWKEESFFLYRDTRLAWLSSPLVREYQEKLVAAINASTRLSDMATGFTTKNTLTPADISALVEVNRVLAV